jgi:hypothetical protein
MSSEKGGEESEDTVVGGEPRNFSGEDLIDLPSGRGYRIGGADEITTADLTKVILVAGTAESGKTTLLATVYLMFHIGPFAGYSFAGSNTLIGFEERAHPSRIASGLSEPTTERSKVSELLHLRVRKEDRSAPREDLLFCDFWGEDFREARDSVEGCKRLNVISRADAFVLLVDGAKLAKPSARQQAKNDPIALLRNILDCQMLAQAAAVDVVFTKWDEIQGSSDPSESESFAKHVEEEMVRRFSSRVKHLRFSRVAAHPKHATVPLGYGLEHLFRTWVDSPVGAARRELQLAAEPPGALEYDRYTSRRMQTNTKR